MHQVSRLAIALGLAAALASPAFAGASAGEFVTKASVSSQFEIDTSKLALERATSADVKAFAQRMIDDHTAAAAKMKAAAEADKIDTSMIASALDEDHQKKFDKLKAAEAKDFDETYMDMQEAAHKDAVSLFKDYADDGEAANLKAFAKETLPTLEAHHHDADKIESKVD